MTKYMIQVKDKTYYLGDKPLRIASIILHTVELGLIIYLLMR